MSLKFESFDKKLDFSIFNSLIKRISNKDGDKFTQNIIDYVSSLLLLLLNHNVEKNFGVLVTVINGSLQKYGIKKYLEKLEKLNQKIDFSPQLIDITKNPALFITVNAVIKLTMEKLKNPRNTSYEKENFYNYLRLKSSDLIIITKHLLNAESKYMKQLSKHNWLKRISAGRETWYTVEPLFEIISKINTKKEILLNEKKITRKQINYELFKRLGEIEGIILPRNDEFLLRLWEMWRDIWNILNFPQLPKGIVYVLELLGVPRPS